MLDDEDLPTQFKNDNLPNDNSSTILQDRTRPHLTNLSRCLENNTANQSRTRELLDGLTGELRSVELPKDKIGTPTEQQT
jgi:hypothetical protein